MRLKTTYITAVQLLLLFSSIDINHYCSLSDDIQAISVQCAEDHKLTPEQLGDLRSTPEEPSSLAVAENVKCFAKCFVSKSGFIGRAGINLQKLLDVGQLYGKSDQEIRENFERCNSVYNVKANKLTCAVAWKLYVCLTQ